MVKLILIGDVHGAWDKDLDPAALKFLKPDAAIFVGDFGEEDVKLVRQIAKVDVPKAVMLGNHDSWEALYYGGSLDKVREQIDILGSDYIGYATKAFVSSEGHDFSVIGGRPFSDGNKTAPSLISKMYRVHEPEDSAERISKLIHDQPKNQTLILVGHNGPTGLGDRRQSICGRDFVRGKQGDYGDKDMQMAIDMAGDHSKDIALVTFGHMHQTLTQHYSQKGAEPQLRNMVEIDQETGTVYLNAAVVPRHNRESGQLETHFVEVILTDGIVTNARNIWLSDAKSPKIVRTEELLETSSLIDGVITRSVFRAFWQNWETGIQSPARSQTSTQSCAQDPS